MKNFEIVMEELKQLNNLDSKIFTTEGRYDKEYVNIDVEGRKYSMTHGYALNLVHGIRAMKLAKIEGTVENVEKGLRVFSMLKSIYCYNSHETAEQMASHDTLKGELYDIGFDNTVIMANYLIEHTEKIETNTYTDSEGCSYNSLYLKDIVYNDTLKS